MRERPSQHGATCFWQGRQHFEEATVYVEHLLGEGKLQLFPASRPMRVAEQWFSLLALSFFLLLLENLPVLGFARLILCILPGCDFLKIRTAR